MSGYEETLGDGDEELEPFEIVELDAFTSIDEPGAEPLLGSDEQIVLPVGGDAMIYGDGGTGKTTLGVDLGFHLAAGDDWLGIPVDLERSVLLVESEGPRPLFRRKLLRKQAAWDGSPLDGRLHVLERPWGKIRFTEADDRAVLAAALQRHAVDVVIAGPIVQLGMDDAGTMQEVRAFAELVHDVRARAGRPVTFVLVHHENKGGRVSGAWEGAGDTLLHVQGGESGRLRLFVQKARWSSLWHRRKLHLVWAGVDTFELEDKPLERAERTFEDLLAYVLEHGGCSWRDARKGVRGDPAYLARRRDAMLEGGELLNTGRPGKYELWHRDDPTHPETIVEPEPEPEDE